MTSAASVISHLGQPTTKSSETLLIAYYFLSLSDSGAARPSRFAKYLRRSGVTAHVITNGESTNQHGESAFPVRCIGKNSEKGGVQLASKLAYHFQRRLLPYNECLPWVPHAVEAGSDIIRNSSITSILSTSPPLATHFAAWELKRRFGLRWIADFRDPLSDNPFRQRRFGKPYDAVIERTIFHSADVIIANTDTVGDLWRNRYPRWAEKIRVIWNGYDAEDGIAPTRLPIRSFQTLTHVGTLYGGRRPTLLLASLLRLINSGRLNPRSFRLRLIGPIDTTVISLNAAPFSTLANLGCLEYNAKSIPVEEARTVIAESDGLLLLDLNERGAALQVPAKLFDYIRIGRPILSYTAVNSPVERILLQSGVPYQCLHPEDPPERLDAGVLDFLKLPSDPVAPNEWFWRQFDPQAQVLMLRDLLGHCV